MSQPDCNRDNLVCPAITWAKKEIERLQAAFKQPFPMIREGDAAPPESRPQDPHLDGRDPKFETLEHGGAEPDTMPNAIRATDPQGRTAIYVPLKIDDMGKKDPAAGHEPTTGPSSEDA